MSRSARREPRRARGPSTFVVVGLVVLLAAGFTLAAPVPGDRTPFHGEGAFRLAGAPAVLECENENTVASLSVVSPASDSGVVGSSVTLQGSGFDSYGPVLIEFVPPSGSGYRQVDYISPGTVEPFTATVSVPDGYLQDTVGVANFWAGDAADSCASATFGLTAVPPTGTSCSLFGAGLTVLVPASASGPQGTSVELQGGGFYPMGSVGLAWADPDGESAVYLGSAAGNPFTTWVTVPSGYSAGNYLIWAADQDSDCASAWFTLTAGGGPTLTLNASAGAVGYQVNATGSGFEADSQINFTFDGQKLPSSCYTNSTGSFPWPGEAPCTFTVPEAPNGDDGGRNVVATDAISDSASATYSVLPSIALSPNAGALGSTFTVTGTGFSEYPSGAAVTFDGQQLTPTGGTDCAYNGPLITLDDLGGFVCTFTVPLFATGGDNPVQGDDTSSGELTGAHAFTTPAQVTISSLPTTGPVGTPVTVTGSGWIPGDYILVAVGPVGDDYSIAALYCAGTIGGEPTVGPSGGFTCDVTFPAVGPGAYWVLATDVSRQTSPITVVYSTNSFTVISQVTITSTPMTGLPGTPVTATGSGWTPGDYLLPGVGFSGDDDFAALVYCAGTSSGEPTVNTSGGFTCDFDFPEVGPGVYFLMVTDKSQQTSPITIVYSTNTFTVPVSPVISVSPILEPGGATFTVTGSGFSPSPSTATISFDGDLMVPTGGSQCAFAGTPLIALNTSGGFVCTFTVPPWATLGANGVQGDDTATGELSSVQSLTVTSLVPTLVLTPGPASISLKESTIVTVTVGGRGPIPTGSVTISDGLSGLNDSCVVAALNASGTGSCVLTPSHFGHLTLTATYGGDSHYQSRIVTAPLFVNSVDLTISPASGSRDETLNVVLAGFSPTADGAEIQDITFGAPKGQVVVNHWTINGLNSVKVQVFVGFHAKLALDKVDVTLKFPSTAPHSVTYETLDMGDFRVTLFAPTMSPTFGSQDETLDVVLGGFTPVANGTFKAGYEVRIGTTNDGVTVDSVTISGLSNITVQITIGQHAKIRNDEVVVHTSTVTAVGQSEKTSYLTLRMGKFRVMGFSVSMTPSSGSQGESLGVALAGFTVSPSAADMTVTFGNVTSGITVDSVTITGLSSITVGITIAPTAPVQRDAVTVVESVPGGPDTAVTLNIEAFLVTT